MMQKVNISAHKRKLVLISVVLSSDREQWRSI